MNESLVWTPFSLNKHRPMDNGFLYVLGYYGHSLNQGRLLLAVVGGLSNITELLAEALGKGRPTDRWEHASLQATHHTTQVDDRFMTRF